MTLNRKELLSGGLVLALALFALFYAAEHYSFGTLHRPGPGVFPIFLAVALGIIGVAMLVQSAFVPVEEPVTIELSNAVWVIASVAVFGLMLRNTGVIPATAVTVLISTMAARDISWARPLTVVVALTVAMVLIFNVGCGMRVPLITGVIY